MLWPKSRIETSGSLKSRYRFQRLSRQRLNMTKNDVGARVIRVQGQRDICLGFRAIEVFFEDCGPRRDKSRKRFVRVLFERLFRMVFGEPKRGIWIITPAILVV